MENMNDVTKRLIRAAEVNDETEKALRRLNLGG